MTPGSDLCLKGEQPFKAALSQFLGCGKLRLLGPEEPSLTSYRFGHCRVSRINSPAFELELAKARHCAGVDDQMVVTVDRSTLSDFETADVRFSNVGSPILITDRTYEAFSSAKQYSERVTFSFPRALLAPELRSAVRRPVTIPSEGGGMPAIFHQMVCAVAKQQDRLSGTDRSRLQRSLIGLVGDMVAATHEGEDSQGPLGLATLRARAVAVIEAELFSLSGVEDLSRRLGCSVRHLYNAFGERGSTPARFIWSLRLDRAREQIRSTGSEASITEIAYGCGFQSYSHFSRAFKGRFGETPQACWRLRSQALEPPLAA